jgi:hypothetical protein
MPRIPGSINSKNGQPVRVIQKWNGRKPFINYLLRDFRRYLIDHRLREQYEKILYQHQQQSKRQRWNYNNNNGPAYCSYIHWIEQLLQTPLKDHRKYCIWRVLSPYLLNIKKIPEQEASNIIREWLQRCSEVRRLSFSINQRINDGLDKAAKGGYLPIGLEKLKQENNRLYSFLHVSGVVEDRQ